MSIDWQLLAEAREGLIVKLEKNLSDAALVEAELREKCAELEAICEAASQDACILGVELAAAQSALLTTGEKK